MRIEVGRRETEGRRGERCEEGQENVYERVGEIRKRERKGTGGWGERR